MRAAGRTRPAALLAVAGRHRRLHHSHIPVEPREGDCFDVPTTADDRVDPDPALHGAARRRGLPCLRRHRGGAYPSDDAWGGLIYPVCDPAFKAYTGTGVETRTDIDYTYLVPTADRWAAGERHVTCFIKSLDGGPLALRHSSELLTLEVLAGTRSTGSLRSRAEGRRPSGRGRTARESWMGGFL